MLLFLPTKNIKVLKWSLIKFGTKKYIQAKLDAKFFNFVIFLFSTYWNCKTWQDVSHHLLLKKYASPILC